MSLPRAPHVWVSISIVLFCAECGGRAGSPPPAVIPLAPGAVLSEVALQEGGSGDSGYAPSIAFGPSQEIAVSFYDAGRGELRWARRDAAGGWSVEDVDGPDAGWSSSVAYFPGGSTPYVAYGFRSTVDASGSLRVARRDEGGWVVSALDSSGPCDSVSLGFDPRGIVKLSYLAGEEGLRYLDWDRGGGIVLQAADSGLPPAVFLPPSRPLGWADMVLLPGALPVLAYYDALGGEAAVARLDPVTGRWSHTRVEWVPVHGEPLAPPAGAVIEGGPCDLQPPYYTLVLAHPSNGDPEETVLYRDGIALPEGDWTWCAADTLGIMPDLYSAQSSYAADYVRTDVGGDDEGPYLSAAVDPGGGVHVAYLDRTALSLKYAEEIPGGWRSEEVDGSSQVGGGTALGIDAQGHPVVAYRSASEQVLKMAHRSSGGWSTRFLDAKGNVGEEPALAFASDGTLAVVYRTERGGRGGLALLLLPSGVLEEAGP